MTIDHVVSTSDYLQSTEAVLIAGRRLRRYLTAERTTQEYAITALERAARQQDISSAAYQNFMFSALDSTPSSELQQQERIAADTLGSVLNDLNVANVLIASGQALGEADLSPETRYLDEALALLDRTSSVLEQPLATPLSNVAQVGRFGFETMTSNISTTNSPDLPAALSVFQTKANATLTSIVNDTKGAILNVLDALKKIDGAKVLSALSKLGEQLEGPPKIGRLLRQGIDKLESACSALTKLLGNEALKKIKEKVEEIWNGVKEGTYITRFLEQVLDIAALRRYIDETLALPNLSHEAVDAASEKLENLLVEFKETTTLFNGILAAITFGGTVLVLVPGISPNIVLLTALADLTILSAILLNGMDYTDSAKLIERVHGVRRIVRGLRPADE